MNIKTLFALFFLGLILLVTPYVTEAEEKIGLVLGGGGARGAAHVGVLKVIESQGIAIDYIAGTSMGAIVGSLYASGYTAHEIEDIVNEINWSDGLSDASPRNLNSMQRKIDEAYLPSDLEVGLGASGIKTPQGLIQGQHLNLLLRKLLSGHEGISSFDELPIPFRAIAADIVTGEKLVIGDGDLVSAVRASMSVPGVFQPIRIDDNLLVDGGIVDNVPVQVARDMGATRLIVVDVGSPLFNESQLTSPLTVTEQVFTVMIQKVTAASLASLNEDDVVIRPELGDISSKAFLRSKETIPLGEQAAMLQIEKLKTFKSSDQKFQQFTENHQRQPIDEFAVNEIIVDENQSTSSHHVATQFSELLGVVVSRRQIENKIAELYGSGRYQLVTYQITKIESGGVKLKLIPVDKHWGPNFARLGLKLSDDFEGDSSFQLSVLTRVRSEANPDAEWRFKLGLGDQSEVGISRLSPINPESPWFFQPSVNWRGLTQRGFTDTQNHELARFRWNRSSAGMNFGITHSASARTYMTLERGIDKLDLLVGPDDFAGIEGQDYAYLGLGFLYDDINHSIFPTAGSRFNTEIHRYFSGLGADAESTLYKFGYQQAFSFGRNTMLFDIKGQTTNNDDIPLSGLTFLGGLGNLSGMSPRQIGGQHMFFSRMMTSRRLTDESQLLKIPIHIGVSLEVGNTWSVQDQMAWDDLIYAGSLFMGMDTPLGPMYLGYGRTNQDDNAFYLHFGSLIGN